MRILLLLVLFGLGCGLQVSSEKLMHPLIRSSEFSSEAEMVAVVSRARLERTEDGRIRVLYVHGTPYERGFQHGYLLRDEIHAHIPYLYRQMKQRFLSEEFFDEVYERARPYIPEAYVQEMHGLAHGAELPLRVVHAIHILPMLTEWGGRKELLRKVEDLGTSCSNLGARGADGTFYALRVLDWGVHRISKLHDYPLITVGRGDDTLSFANIGWVGFLGAISGMNEKGITLGEMGYGDPPGETLKGVPMPFLLREIMARAQNLEQVRDLIQHSKGTNSFAYIMTDGQTSEFYIRDANRFRVFSPGEDVKDGSDYYPGLAGISYGGAEGERMYELLEKYQSQLTPEIILHTIVPEVVLKGNFQNVLYDPVGLRFWVSYASTPGRKASDEPYTLFDFGAALSAAVPG